MEEVIVSEVDLVSKLPIHEANPFLELLGARGSRSSAQSFANEASDVESLVEEFGEHPVPGEFFEGSVRGCVVGEGGRGRGGDVLGGVEAMQWRGGSGG
jgi:hypothetical protein